MENVIDLNQKQQPKNLAEANQIISLLQESLQLQQEKIQTIAGENVNYVKPDHFNKSEITKDIIFSFRVKRPDRRVLIQFKDQNNKVIYKRKKRYVIPSEMIELRLNLEELKMGQDCKDIEVEVIPQPEVLIDNRNEHNNWRESV